MSIVCFTWDDCYYSWEDAPFTWEEGCVIEKVSGLIGGLSPYRKARLREDLTKQEKEVLVNLFFRMNIDEIVIEDRSSKIKNKQINVKVKDVETLVSAKRLVEIKSINIKEPINEEKITVKVVIK